MTTRPDPTRDRPRNEGPAIDLIEVILAEHIQTTRNRRCICGWRPDFSDVRPGELFVEYRQHRRHVAEQIVAARSGR